MEDILYRISKWPTWLRWLVVLPLSIAVYFLTNLLFNVIGTVFSFVGNSPYNEKFFTHLLSPCIGGYYCITVPLETTQRHKRLAGIVLSSIWMAAYGAGAVFGLKVDGWKGLLPVVLSTLGTLYAFSEITSDYAEDKGFATVSLASDD